MTEPTEVEQEESAPQDSLTPLRAVGEKIKSQVQSINAPINNYLNEASTKAGALFSHLPGLKKDSPESDHQEHHEHHQADDDSTVYTNPPILHVSLSGMTSGLALSSEWGRNETSGSIRPGQTLFSVEIDENFRPHQLTLDTRATAAYRVRKFLFTSHLILYVDDCSMCYPSNY